MFSTQGISELSNTSYSRRHEAVWILGLFVALSLLFRFFPEIDLWAARLFYEADRGFYSPTNWWLAIPYRGMPILAQTTALVLLLGWIGSFVFQRWLPIRRIFGFLLAAAIIGPHLIVGIGLKENVGRARPANIVEFGGSQTFTPAYVLSDQCKKNCAFVSAHVASASFLMAFGWLGAPAVRRRWLLAGAGFAAILGLARMLQGGHFLSDVTLPYFFVYWGMWVTEGFFWRFRWLPVVLSGED